MEKQCDCQDLIRNNFFETLRQENKEPISLRFKLSGIMSMRERSSIKKTGQEVELRYSYKNKKGEEKQKTETSFVTHNFCPFCGVEY
jgi:hypothetical protein